MADKKISELDELINVSQDDILVVVDSNVSTTKHLPISSMPVTTAMAVDLDARDVANRDRVNHTGNQLASTISDLDNAISTNAVVIANADRANHTGTQLAATISDFDTEVSNNVDVAANTSKTTWLKPDGNISTLITDDIQTDGNVGIGTGLASPGAMLEVAGDVLVNGMHLGRGASDNLTNTGFGSRVFEDTTIAAVNNTALGFEALANLTSGSSNVAVGRRALLNLQEGVSNVAIGTNALQLTTTASNNVGIGTNALGSTLTGSSNMAIGANAMQGNQTGSSNVALGASSLRDNVSGSSSLSLGASALRRNINGSSNVALGGSALLDDTTSSRNVAIGFQSLQDLNIIDSSNGLNTAIGYRSGNGLITGRANTIIGANVIGLAPALSNNIILSDGDGNQRINVDGTGNVGIGTNAPNALLEVSGKALIDSLEIWRGNNSLPSNLGIGGNILGSITTGVSNTAIGTNSLASNSTGSINTAISTGALQFNLSGGNNTAIGVNALRFNNSGAGNLAIGLSASRDGTTKINTIAIGNNALSGGNGGGNVAIGVNAGIAATGTNNTFIGNFIDSNDSESVFIGQNGNVRLQVDSTGNHIYPDYGDSRTELAVIRHQSGMDASGQKVQQLLNEGQIKVNGSGGVKPSITGWTANVGQFFQYNNGALNLSLSPTTQFPLNQAAIGTSIVDPGTFQLLENPELGSVNLWRINFTYAGKSSSANVGVEIGLMNPASTFMVSSTITLPTGLSDSPLIDFGGGDIRTGVTSVLVTTIADSLSIGTGYKLFASTTVSDSNFNITIESVVRYNATKYKR